MLYGILKSVTNTGIDSELQYVFSTPLVIRSNQPAYVSDTLSLKRKVNSQKVQRWEIDAQIQLMNDSPNFLIHSVNNGYDTVFYLRMPQIFVSSPTPSGLSLTMTSLKNIGSSTIDITGLGTADLTGQFINFAGNSKVYLITSKGTAGVGLGISPPLLTAISATTAIKYGGNTTMYARYDMDTSLGITYVDGILTDQGSVKFIEAL